MTRTTRVLFLSSLLCTAVAAIPRIATAQTPDTVYYKPYCIRGNASIDGSGNVTATVYTDGLCTGAWGSTMLPFVSSQVSVYPIVWYYDQGSGAWNRCQVGSEVKLSNTHTAMKAMTVTSCPHGRYLSVWAHVAAQPKWTSTWYGGDYYCPTVVWYP
jgi:hypothetical protein